MSWWQRTLPRKAPALNRSRVTSERQFRCSARWAAAAGCPYREFVSKKVPLSEVPCPPYHAQDPWMLSPAIRPEASKAVVGKIGQISSPSGVDAGYARREMVRLSGVTAVQVKVAWTSGQKDTPGGAPRSRLSNAMSYIPSPMGCSASESRACLSGVEHYSTARGCWVPGNAKTSRPNPEKPFRLLANNFIAGGDRQQEHNGKQVTDGHGESIPGISRMASAVRSGAFLHRVCARPL